MTGNNHRYCMCFICYSLHFMCRRFHMVNVMCSICVTVQLWYQPSLNLLHTWSSLQSTKMITANLFFAAMRHQQRQHKQQHPQRGTLSAKLMSTATAVQITIKIEKKWHKAFRRTQGAVLLFHPSLSGCGYGWVSGWGGSRGWAAARNSAFVSTRV